MLKAALGAPLVLTVRPASATGAWSSAGVCKTADADAATSNPPPAWLTQPSDQWMRSTVTCLKMQKQNGQYMSEDFFCDTSMGTNTYYKITSTSVVRATYDECRWGYKTTSKQCYVLSYMDDSGKCVGYTPDCGGHPMTGSCWSSIKTI